MEDRSEPQNLDDFAVECHGILQIGPWNLAKFSVENCGPWLYVCVCNFICLVLSLLCYSSSNLLLIISKVCSAEHSLFQT